MRALAARKGRRKGVEIASLRPPERPAAQQFAWEVEGGIEALEGPQEGQLEICEVSKDTGRLPP